MLKSTFLHLPGVGIAKEKSLWDRGVHSWDVFCHDATRPILPFGAKKYALLCEWLQQGREKLCSCDPAFFANSLAQQQLWRLFAEFRECTAYLDIETTGLGGPRDYITTAAVYNGRCVTHFIHGHNLDQLIDELGKYKILVTYNGSCFDLPFIRNHFGIALDQVHIDLRYLLSSLGFRGGLKRCEKQLGLDRAELDGVDGYFAVLLWQEYQQRRNSNALETLLAYNIADTVNLENLMVQAYNLKIDATPLRECKLPLPSSPAISFRADARLVTRLRDRYFGGFGYTDCTFKGA